MGENKDDVIVHAGKEDIRLAIPPSAQIAAYEDIMEKPIRKKRYSS